MGRFLSFLSIFTDSKKNLFQNLFHATTTTVSDAPQLLLLLPPPPPPPPPPLQQRTMLSMSLTAPKNAATATSVLLCPFSFRAEIEVSSGTVERLSASTTET